MANILDDLCRRVGSFGIGASFKVKSCRVLLFLELYSPWRRTFKGVNCFFMGILDGLVLVERFSANCLSLMDSAWMEFSKLIKKRSHSELLTRFHYPFHSFVVPKVFLYGLNKNLSFLNAVWQILQFNSSVLEFAHKSLKFRLQSTLK